MNLSRKDLKTIMNVGTALHKLNEIDKSMNKESSKSYKNCMISYNSEDIEDVQEAIKMLEERVKELKAKQATERLTKINDQIIMKRIAIEADLSQLVELHGRAKALGSKNRLSIELPAPWHQITVGTHGLKSSLLTIS